MAIRSHQASGATRRVALALSLWLVAGSAVCAQGPAPFQRLAGQWSGSGVIDFADGNREPIRCRASYDLLGEINKLQFDIRCASASYHFDLRGSASYSNGAITGNWSEVTRNAAGTMSGTAKGSRFQVMAQSAAYTASLTLQTRGNRQTVTIQSPDPSAQLRGASINLRKQ